MGMKGFFELKTAADLRSKLQYEYAELRKDPRNAYNAFNFFVTAEHLLDWRYPGDDTARTTARRSEVILQITSHLASGAKHFELHDKRHKSVSATRQVGGTFGAWTFRANFFASNYLPKGALVVELDGDAAVKLGGSSITVVELAEKVLEYWDRQSLR